jgi:thiosulfate/3-mercaptopyruvate sulfurtransferase
MSESADLRARHLIETYELAALIASGEPKLRVVDMRGYVRAVTDPNGEQSAQYCGAEDEYLAGHIPGAIYLDWTRDIVDETDPVPAQVAGAEKIARVLGESGIGDDSLVVAYDNHPASQFATRLWWVFRYFGHDNVRVLNGGWAAWTREGRETTSERPAYPPAIFTPRIDAEWRATAEQVRDWIGSPDITLIDARDEGQYTGRVRRGLRGGRIPGADWLPREALIGPDGRFLSPDQIAEITQPACPDPEGHVVAYCNGGVAATTVLFALSSLGYTHLTNYDGSWNEWNLRTDLPVDPGDSSSEGSS